MIDASACARFCRLICEVAPQVNLFHFAQPTLGLPVQIARFVEHEIDAQRALDRLLVTARRTRQFGVARQQHRRPRSPSGSCPNRAHGLVESRYSLNSGT